MPTKPRKPKNKTPKKQQNLLPNSSPAAIKAATSAAAEAKAASDEAELQAKLRPHRNTNSLTSKELKDIELQQTKLKRLEEALALCGDNAEKKAHFEAEIKALKERFEKEALERNKLKASPKKERSPAAAEDENGDEQPAADAAADSNLSAAAAENGEVQINVGVADAEVQRELFPAQALSRGEQRKMNAALIGAVADHSAQNLQAASNAAALEKAASKKTDIVNADSAVEMNASPAAAAAELNASKKVNSDVAIKAGAHPAANVVVLNPERIARIKAFEAQIAVLNEEIAQIISQYDPHKDPDGTTKRDAEKSRKSAQRGKLQCEIMKIKNEAYCEAELAADSAVHAEFIRKLSEQNKQSLAQYPNLVVPLSHQSQLVQQPIASGSSSAVNANVSPAAADAVSAADNAVTPVGVAGSAAASAEIAALPKPAAADIEKLKEEKQRREKEQAANEAKLARLEAMSHEEAMEYIKLNDPVRYQRLQKKIDDSNALLKKFIDENNAGYGIDDQVFIKRAMDEVYGPNSVVDDQVIIKRAMEEVYGPNSVVNDQIIIKRAMEEAFGPSAGGGVPAPAEAAPVVALDPAYIAQQKAELDHHAAARGQKQPAGVPVPAAPRAAAAVNANPALVAAAPAPALDMGSIAARLAAQEVANRKRLADAQAARGPGVPAPLPPADPVPVPAPARAPGAAPAVAAAGVPAAAVPAPAIAVAPVPVAVAAPILNAAALAAQQAQQQAAAIAAQQAAALRAQQAAAALAAQQAASTRLARLRKYNLIGRPH